MKWALVNINPHNQNKGYTLRDDTQHDLGRGKECILKCLSLYASRIHCRIFTKGDHVHVEDNKSSNGTYVNGILITPGKKVELKENDLIGVGVRVVLDEKSLVLKLVKEDGGKVAESPADLNGKRKREEEDDSFIQNKAMKVDSVVANAPKGKSDVNSSFPCFSSPALCTSTPIASSKPSDINGSLHEPQSSHENKGNVLDIIDLVDSDEEDIKPNVQENQKSLEENKDESSVSKVIDTSGYADENDVIVISDDEDGFFSSSQIQSDDKSPDNDNVLQSEDNEEKGGEKVWDVSESEEESDNEWWPKLSQSFFDSSQNEEEEEESAKDRASRDGEGCDKSEASRSGKSDALDDFVALSNDELEMDEEEGNESPKNSDECVENANPEEENENWFPVLSCGFSDSESEDDDDDDAKSVSDQEDVNVGDESEKGETKETDELDMDVEEEDELRIIEEDKNSEVVKTCTESEAKVESSSVSKCTKGIGEVKISQLNESNDGLSDVSLESLSISSDFNASKDTHSLALSKNDKLNDEERRILLNAKNFRKGPQLVTPPMLKRGRICMWEEKKKETEASESVPSVEETTVTPSPVQLKNCEVILTDIMYGKKKKKVKRDENFGRTIVQNRSPGVLSKAEKRKIKENRRLKLQALSEKEPKNITSPNAISPVGQKLNDSDKISPDSKDRPGKVAAKVTSKNRGAFLTEFDIFSSSASAPGSRDKKKKEKKKQMMQKDKDKALEKEGSKLSPIEGESEAKTALSFSELESHKKHEISSASVSSVVTPTTDKKARGILRQSLEKKKLRVSFKEEHEVRMFNITPGSKLLPVRGKDLKAPPPLFFPQGDTLVNEAPPVLSVVYDICRWNAHWLEEQRSRACSEPPPVNLKLPLNPILGSYSSYKEYFNSFYPVMLFELWAKVFREWDQNFARHQIIQVLLESASDIPESPSCPRKDFVIISCQFAAPERQLNPFDYPKVGDLCILDLPEEIPISGDGTTSNPTAVIVRVFAYVDSVKRNHHAPKVPDKDFGKGPEPTALYSLSLKLKKRAHKICIGKEARMKIVCHLLSDLRSFEALIELPKSPLARHILNPSGLVMQAYIPTNFRLKSGENLNPSQQKAVALAKTICQSNEPKICLIQGPPGTGKTKVIVTLLRELFEFENKSLSQKRKENKTPKILLCAPSNAAIDNVVKRLLAIRVHLKKENRFRLVRVGRLEAMNPAVRDISLQELTSKEVNNNTCSDVDGLNLQVSTLQAKINSFRLALDTSVTRNDLKNKSSLENKIKETEQKLEEIKKIKGGNSNTISNKQRRQLEQTAERNVLRCADIVATTLASCVNNSMLDAFVKESNGKSHFNCCIIDEACQSLELDSLLPLQLGIEKLILVGDQEQLYPTVMSMVAKQYGLEISLFERLWACLSKEEKDPSTLPLVLLNVQYRMHPAICHWPNFSVYNGLLETPSELEMERMSPFLPYVVISLEFDQNDPNQLLNCSEAELVSKLYYAMAEKAEKRHYSIGVITPYQKQKNAIEAALSRRRMAAGKGENTGAEVNTIDSFQGQERDIIILSCVRSYGVGFLADRRRINVAMTRARRSLIVCGNFISLKDNNLWNAFLADGLSRGLVKCVSGSCVPNQKELLNLVLR